MRNLYLEIKWAYQRVVRGYDERVMWQFDSYFIQIIPALKEFCINKLQDKQYIDLNEKRCKIYSKTLDLIEAYENPVEIRKEGAFTVYDWTHDGEKLAELAEYFGKNIGYYWD